jgi:uncharacterized protein YsxB (DUF464 family)
MIGEEIILEIDATLDRLICNAEAIQNVNLSELSEMEIQAFQKTQESLLQHFMHMDQFLETKTKHLKTENKKSSRNQMREKFLKFEKLKESYHKEICNTLTRKSEILSKRRGKRILITR